jgi:hypothetical protein
MRRPVARRRPRWPVWAGAGGLAVATLVAAVLVASRETGDAPTSTTEPPTTTCEPLPYQPCGQPAAPNTDGRACLETFDDYDADAANGCEAAADGLADGSPLRDSLEATLVPRDDVDTFSMEVGDGSQLLCDGRFTVTLTAPPGVSMRLEVLDGDEVLGQTASADGVPATVGLDEPRCLNDDSTTLTARVSPIGSDRSAAPYRLERRGSF